MNRVFETERLLMRPLNLSDTDDVFEWVSDPEVNKYLMYALYKKREEVVSWINSLTDSDLLFAVLLKEENKVIGSISISYSNRLHGFELGYNFNKNYWGKGYAFESVNALLKWGQENLDINSFYVSHIKENVRSQNVILKLGGIYFSTLEVKKESTGEVFSVLNYKIDFKK